MAACSRSRSRLLARLDPSSEDSQIALLPVLRTLQPPGAREPYLRGLAAAAPRLLGGHLMLGGTLAARGRETEAVTAYRRALEIDPFSNEANQKVLEVSFGSAPKR